jgi:hypothetical protein
VGGPDSHGIKVARSVSGERRAKVRSDGKHGKWSVGQGATCTVPWVRLVVALSRRRYFAGHAGRGEDHAGAGHKLFRTINAGMSRLPCATAITSTKPSTAR